MFFFNFSTMKLIFVVLISALTQFYALGAKTPVKHITHQTNLTHITIINPDILCEKYGDEDLNILKKTVWFDSFNVKQIVFFQNCPFLIKSFNQPKNQSLSRFRVLRL